MNAGCVYRRRMATSLRIGLAGLTAVASISVSVGQETDFDPDEPVYWDQPMEWPDADVLLAGVRAALPEEKLRITAVLQSKDRVGHLEKSLNADILLDWGRDTGMAEYLVRDAFGTDLERLVVSRTTAEGSHFAYQSGSPLKEADPPPMNQPIQGTDITWADLTLDFLWWPGGRTVGAERIRGRYCYIVEFSTAELGRATGALRLWVEPKARVLLRAAAYDAEGSEIRRLDIKSLRKIDDLWVLKDLEVRTYPTRHKTLLRVRTVERGSVPAI